MAFPGQMMDYQLTITTLMQYAEQIFPQRTIVSVTHDNPRHRYTYSEAFSRVAQLANALSGLGLKQGDRVATLAWNDYRHFEVYYAVSCSGFVCHTINPRLFSEQIEYIINHAEDQVLLVDPMFVPLIAPLRDKLTSLKTIVVLSDEANMPADLPFDALCYETFIGGQPTQFDYPELEESCAAALCYTSGTTGNPKGVLYSHRSTVLHAMVSVMPNALNITGDDVVMPIVPMFHVNAWGIPYSAMMLGAKLVFPGNKMADGETLCDLINSEKITFSAGVPTVWLALYQHLESSGKQVPTLKRCIVGGSACPLGLMKAYESKYGVYIQTAWGMTELSPLGSVNIIRDEVASEQGDAQDRRRQSCGMPVYGVETKAVDENNNALPWDGETVGELKVRGPWVCGSYFKLPDSEAHDDDGWFATGDVVTIDEFGYIQITDRAKDVIKSGGEWISSIELENIATDHPDIAQAAVIGIFHPKWDERPLLIAAKNPGAGIDGEGLVAHLTGKVAKWWLPDAVEFVDSIPLTATGKIDKKVLREKFKDFSFE